VVGSAGPASSEHAINAHKVGTGRYAGSTAGYLGRDAGQGASGALTTCATAPACFAAGFALGSAFVR
jgi:hypothetical protein